MYTMLEWQPARHCPAQDLGRGEPRQRRPRSRSPPPPADPDHYWGRQGGRNVTVGAGEGMQWSSAIVLCCFSIQPAASTPSSLPRPGHQDERPWLPLCVSTNPSPLPSFPPSCRPLPSLLVRHTHPPPPCQPLPPYAASARLLRFFVRATCRAQPSRGEEEEGSNSSAAHCLPMPPACLARHLLYDYKNTRCC